MKILFLKNFLILLSVIAYQTAFAQITTVSIPLSLGSGQDSYLASGSPSTNYGTHTSIGGNTWTCSGNLCLSRGLFQFDLSSIPTGATITNASLELFADPNTSINPTQGPNNEGYLQRVTSAWAENAVTWNSQPGTTAVNQVLIPASTSTAQNYTLTVTALVQDMLTNGNYGFMLKMQDEINYYKSLMFASSDNAISSSMPVLTVSYITGTGISTSISLCDGSGQDSYLASGSPSTNYGTHTSIGGNTWTCSGNLCLSRGLFQFDLSSIPTGATITNASLELFADPNTSINPTQGPNNEGYLQRVTSAWVENAVTWNTQPGTTAINQVLIPASTSTTQNYTLTVTALVQDMLTNNNYGFMLKMQDEINYYKSLMFASSDNSTSLTTCPILNIIYTNPTGIKESNANNTGIIYPNPCTGVANIKSDKIIKEIVVSDLMGKVLLRNSSVLSASCSLDLPLSPGIYLVQVYGDSNALDFSQKIVKID